MAKIKIGFAWVVLFFSLLVPMHLDARENRLPVVLQPFNKTISMNEIMTISLGSLVTDVDGDDLFVKIVTLPKKGVVGLEQIAKIPVRSGTKESILEKIFRPDTVLVQYTPNVNFVGEDDFLFSVSDRKGEFQVGKIQITVVNPLTPLPANKQPSVIKGVFETRVGEPISLNIHALILDADGDQLVTDFHMPEFGHSRSFAKSILGRVDRIDAGFSYIPEIEGDDNFNYIVKDGHGHFVVGSVEIRNKPAYPLTGLKKHLTLFVRIGFKILFIFGLLLLLPVLTEQFYFGRVFREKIRWFDVVMLRLHVLQKFLGEKIKQYFLPLILLMFNFAYFYYYYCRTILPLKTTDSSYYYIYEFFKYGIIPPDIGIFLSRLLVPFLASLVPSDNPIFCFWVINFVFMNLTVLIMYRVWSLLSVRKYFIFLAFFWFCFHPHGIVILYNLIPFTSDMLQYVFFAALLLIVVTKKYKWLLILTPIATLGKETCLSMVMMFFVFGYFHNKFHPDGDRVPLSTIFISLLLGGIARQVPTHWIILSDQNLVFDTLRSLWFSFLIRFGVVFEFVIIWLIIQFFAFGGLLLVGIQNFVNAYKNTLVFNSLLLFSFLSALISLLLSGTLERLTFYSYPFVMTLILLLINRLSVRFITLVFVLSLPLLSLYAVRPFDDVLFFGAAGEFERMSLYGIYMLMLWTLIRHLFKVKWGENTFPVPKSETNSEY